MALWKDDLCEVWKTCLSTEPGQIRLGSWEEHEIRRWIERKGGQWAVLLTNLQHIP